MTAHRNPASVIRAARQALSYAERGWRDYLERGERGDAGLATAITTARSVTNVLQNLRGMDERFEPWWHEHVQVLNEPGARWVVDARNMIEKQGVVVGLETAVQINRLDGAQVALMMDSAPARTVGMFIGDEHGRSGWIVELDDGTTTSVFFSLPPSIGSSWASLPSVGGRSLEDVFPEYLHTLRGLIDAAGAQFSTDS